MNLKYKKFLIRNVLASILAMSISHTSFALPVEFNNSTAAEFSTIGTQLNVRGKKQNNIINWASFNVNSGEIVKFENNKNYLNLVHGVDMSRIYGTLSGGNIVYLVNPNGILFGQGATIDNMGSFIASTRNISSINKQAFLDSPEQVQTVLGIDKTDMDNTRYYGSTNMTVPKISMAELQLTNVPTNKGLVIMDGPGGVIIKNKEVMKSLDYVMTRKESGEIGIGTSTDNLVLNDSEKEKIRLIDGAELHPYDSELDKNIIKPYKIIMGLKEFSLIKDDAKNGIAGNYLLNSDIDASKFSHNPLNGIGNFDGLGYTINKLFIYSTSSRVGLFSSFDGNIRNLNLTNVDIMGTADWYTAGLVGHMDVGTINNVTVSGKVEGTCNVAGLVAHVGTAVEIRNSINNANLTEFKSERRYQGTGSDIYPSDKFLGGLIAEAGANTKYVGIYNSYNLADINQTPQWLTTHFSQYLGGIVGGVFAGEIKVVDTVNYGNIDITRGEQISPAIVSVGGIIGGVYKNYYIDQGMCLDNVYNTGSINIDTPGSRSNVLGGVIGSRAGEIVKADAYYIKDSITESSKTLITEISEKDGTTGETGGSSYTNNIGIKVDRETMSEMLKPAFFGIILDNNQESAGGNDETGTDSGETGGKPNNNGGQGVNDNSNIDNVPNFEKPDIPSINTNDEKNKDDGVTEDYINQPKDGEYNNTIIANNQENNEKNKHTKLKNNDNADNSIESGESQINPEALLKEVKSNYKKISEALDKKIIDYIKEIYTANDQKADQIKQQAKVNAEKEVHDMLTVTPYDYKDNMLFDNDLRKEIVQPFISKLDDKVFAKYDVDEYGKKIFLKTMNSVAEGMGKSEPFTVNKDGIEFKVDYSYEPGEYGIGVLGGKVTWTDPKTRREKTANFVFTNLYTKDGIKKLSNYSDGLKDILIQTVEEAAAIVISEIFEGVVKKPNAKNFVKKVEDLMVALTNEDAATEFLYKYLKTDVPLLDYSSKDFLKQVLIKSGEQGKNIVDIIDSYNNAKQKMTTAQKKVAEATNIINTLLGLKYDENLIQTVVDCDNVINNLSNMVDNL